MSSRWSKLMVVILLGCLSPVVFADMKYQPADPVWQKEFGYKGFSCIPHLLFVRDNGEVIVIGTMLNQRDSNSVGRVWQWTLDKKTGERLNDITLKSAKRKDCGAISDFWPTKGLDIIDGNESQLFIDPMEANGKQSLIRNKTDRTIEKFETNTQATGKGFFAGRMKRINANEYFLFGSDQGRGYGVLQKRNNRNDVIWEKQYQYGSFGCITGIAQCKTHGLAITGWTEDKGNKNSNAWINLITDDGTVIASEVFDINAIAHIRVPQIAVLDNNNIAVTYNRAFEGQSTGIEYRIYSADLKLKFKDSVAVSNLDFLHYGMVAIDGGFVIVNDMFESGIQYRILHQYNCDGKKIMAIKIDGVGGLGGDQVIVEGKGKTVYIASMKTPVLPPVRTVITALQLSSN